MASSAIPYKRTPPSWAKATAKDVEEHVCKLAKKGLTPSNIGVILRDSFGIAQVKSVTGSKILRLLKKNLLAPEIPEDLYMLIKKAVAVRKHLERNRKDKDSKFRLILIESRIHRLVRSSPAAPLPSFPSPFLHSLPPFVGGSFSNHTLRQMLLLLLTLFPPSLPPSLSPLRPATTGRLAS